MRRIIVGAIMLLAIPVLANGVAIANFAVERYADYTYPSVERWMPKTYWMSSYDFASYCEKLKDQGKETYGLGCFDPSPDGWTFTHNENGERVPCCGIHDHLQAQEKAKEAGMYERIYSADTSVIVRDSVLALLGVGGIAIIVSGIVRRKK